MALAVTFYFSGNFESARQYAIRGAQIWRSGDVRSPVKERIAPVLSCLCCEALSQWHLGEIPSCQATMAEAIALAKGLNDMHALAGALWFAGILAVCKRNPAEVERLTSDLIEVCTRQNFATWLPAGSIFRGWARSTAGDTAENLAWIEDGISDYRASGATLAIPFYLALKAEALHLADRTSEALEVITAAEALVARTEERWWCAEQRQLRAVFLAAMGAEEAQIEASFCEAIRIARAQKLVSLEKRAEATYAEYHVRRR